MVDVPGPRVDGVEQLSLGQVVDVETKLLPVGQVLRAVDQLSFLVSFRTLLSTMTSRPASANTSA